MEIRSREANKQKGRGVRHSQEILEVRTCKFQLRNHAHILAECREHLAFTDT